MEIRHLIEIQNSFLYIGVSYKCQGEKLSDKLVIAVASSALFDLTESDSIFKAQGLKAYKEYQKKNAEKPFDKRNTPVHERMINTLNSWVAYTYSIWNSKSKIIDEFSEIVKIYIPYMSF